MDMLQHRPPDIASLAVALVCSLGLVIERPWTPAADQHARQDCGTSPAAKRFNRTELLLGLSKPDGSAVTDAQFQSFIDTEVTPRLPEGFTIVAGSGQFKDSRGAIVRESARVLVVLHPLAADGRSSQRIEEIRASYKSRYQQESVARVDGESCASF
jgi:hypothetical protein